MPARPPKGVSLGLEDETDFGSDEDTMDTVGEIVETSAAVWYPGMPEPEATDKKSSKWRSKDKKGSLSSGSSLSRSRKGSGLGDAKVVVTDTSPAQSVADTASLASRSVMSFKKEKGKNSMFGKFFKKKDFDGASVAGMSRINDSVESFGSAQPSDMCESCAGLAVKAGLISAHMHTPELINAAPMPPTHTPVPYRGAPPSGPLPSVPPLPPIGAAARAQRRAPPATPSQRPNVGTSSRYPASDNSGDPLLRGVGSVGQPSIAGSDDTHDRRPVSPAAAPLHAQVLGLIPSDDGHTEIPPARFSPSPAISPVESSDLVGFLVPPFPTTEPTLEGTTILSTTVMRRVPLPAAQAEKWAKSFRSSQSSSNSTSSRRSIWQTHQLVLTSFRLGGSPTATPDPSTEAITRTVAQLHLFAFNTPPRGRSSSTSLNSNSTSGRLRPTASMEGAGKVEVDRRAVKSDTIAGVWEGDEESTPGRKWVLKVRFGDDEVDEWLCDMPSG